jgi:hypothetical protein
MSAAASLTIRRGMWLRRKNSEVPQYVAAVFNDTKHGSMMLERWGTIGERRDCEGVAGQIFTMKDAGEHWEAVSLDYVRKLARTLPSLQNLLAAKNL